MIKDNVSMLIDSIKGLNYEVGIIDSELNSLTKKAIKEIIDNIDEEYTDLFITIRKKLYVIEIATVDNEKDIFYYKAYDYFRKYGNLDECYECGSITEEQYGEFCDMGLS